LAATVGKAAGQRLAGSQPGRARSLLSAVVVGLAAATLTYRLLRSGQDRSD
jgi:hypothetical protein